MRSTSPTFLRLLTTARRSLATGACRASKLTASVSVLCGLNRKFVVVADHDLGLDDVGPQQRLGGLLHRGAGESAHVADAACQRFKLLMERRTHIVEVRPRGPAAGLDSWL